MRELLPSYIGHLGKKMYETEKYTLRVRRIRPVSDRRITSQASVVPASVDFCGNHGKTIGHEGVL